PPVPGRAVPMAAAAAAILVAGVSGALVTGGGEGARAAIVARAPAAAVAPPAAVTATTTAATGGTATTADASAPSGAASDDAPAADDAPVADVPVADAPISDDPGTGDAPPDPETTPDDPTIEPHVWLLALEGPRAGEAIDRIAEQGVRLTGARPAGVDTIGNATTLLTGSPAAGAGGGGAGAAGGSAAAAAAPSGTDGAASATAAPSGTDGAANADASTSGGAADGADAPSLPEELTTGGKTWRSYVDVQPGETPALPGACTDPPAGDAAAATLAGRTPFGRIPALRKDDACAGGTFSLETLTNDVSSGETLPSLSYATLGGCAPPERSVVALPDQVSDTVTAITESTEFQENGVVIVTTVGATDPCPVPGAAAAPTAPVVPGAGLPPAPTVVLRADAEPGTTLDVAADLRALTRLTASTLGVDPPGTSGADDVPALELPAAGG
ncbi:MAG: hypothetical protein Q7T67_17015, partial [Patulibacter sp.]